METIGRSQPASQNALSTILKPVATPVLPGVSRAAGAIVRRNHPPQRAAPFTINWVLPTCRFVL